MLTHAYGPSDYGNYALGLGLTTFLVTIVATGVGLAAVVLYPKADGAAGGASLVTATIWLTGLGVATIFSFVLLCLYLLGPLISSQLRGFLLAGAVLFVPLSALTVGLEVLRAQLKPGPFIVMLWTYNVGNLLSSGVLIVGLHASILTVLWVSVGTTAVFALLTLERLGGQIRWGSVKRSDLARLWEFAWPISVGGTGSWIFRLSDRYLLQAFAGTFAVGLYSSAYDLAERIANFLIVPVVQATQPLVAHAAAAAGDGDYTLRQSLRMYLIGAGGLVLTALWGGPLIVQLAFGQRFAAAAGFFGILLIANVLGGIAQVGFVVLAVRMKQRVIAGLQIGTAAVKIVVNLIAIPLGGVLGASVATLGMSLLLIGCIIVATGSNFRSVLVSREARGVLLMVVASLVVAAVVVESRHGLIPNWLPLALSLGIYCVLASLVLMGARFRPGWHRFQPHSNPARQKSK